MRRPLPALLASCLLFVAVFQSRPALALSPMTMKANVMLSRPTETSNSGIAVFVNASQVVAAFNKGRRTEELQFGFPANSLGIFSLPVGYESMTPQQRALYLINTERQIRAGFDYGSGPVLGKPLEGLEEGLVNTAQGHADFLDSTKTFTHIGKDGSTGFDRIFATYPASCRQSLGLGEILYSGPTAFNIEAAVFNWIYMDSSSGGTRLTLLIQDNGISGKPNPFLSIGYVDDHGANGSEGFLGIGVKGNYIVLNIADPSNAVGCQFSIMQEDPLPVRLISWSGKYEERTVQLKWQTAWEEQAEYFQIERSLDLKSFVTIAKIAAMGDSREQQSYEWTDTAPAPGVNYYRLKQADRAADRFGGATQAFRIIAIRTDQKPGRLTVYPNPVGPGEPLRFANGAITSGVVRLYNLAGNEIPVRTDSSDKGELRIQPTLSLPAGMYVISVKEDSGQIRQTSVIVSH